MILGPLRTDSWPVENGVLALCFRIWDIFNGWNINCEYLRLQFRPWSRVVARIRAPETTRGYLVDPRRAVATAT